MIRSLHPQAGAVDPMEALNHQDRATSGRPYVLTNMVCSMDGAIEVDGVSGGLGGEADFEVFMALRSVVDVIVVGAETVRAERYRPPKTRPGARQHRERRGQADRPLICVITGSGRLPLDLPLFADPTYRPLVVCGADADASALEALAGVAEVMSMPTPAVDPAVLLGALHERGAQTVLLEGGPSVNGAFVAADCIDEWNLTMSPQLVGGQAGRAATGPAGDPRGFTVSHLWTADGLIFIQWRRDR